MEYTYQLIESLAQEGQKRWLSTAWLFNDEEGDAPRPAFVALVETPFMLPPQGKWDYSKYEQACVPTDSNIASEKAMQDRYTYLYAMLKGAMYRPNVPNAMQDSVLLGLGGGYLSSLAETYLPGSTLTYELSSAVIELARHHMQHSSHVEQRDAYDLIVNSSPGAEFNAHTIFVDLFGQDAEGELATDPRFYTRQFIRALARHIAINGVVVMNLGDTEIGGPYHKEIRYAMQYFGEEFGQVHVAKVIDPENSEGNYVLTACMVANDDPVVSSDKYCDLHDDFTTPAIFKNIKFQRFHRMGSISRQYPVGSQQIPTTQCLHVSKDEPLLWSQTYTEYGADPTLSLTQDFTHMNWLMTQDIELGAYDKLDVTYAYSRTKVESNMYLVDEPVAILPFFTPRTCRNKDGSVIYTKALLGEDIVINFEPLIKPEWFLRVCQELPPYISQDISFHYSDRVWRSISLWNVPPEQELEKVGVCLFEYETTQILPLVELYPMMERKTRKECQRLMRNAEEKFEISYDSFYPDDPSWPELLESYQSYRTEVDEATKHEEDYVSSVAGTLEHLQACYRAGELGLLRTVCIREKEGNKLVAVNFAIAAPHSQTLSDVVCVRHCDDSYKRYGLGIVSILQNMQYASLMPNMRWYDLGNIGTENKYKYKQMFFTDLTLRFGIGIASPATLIEASLKDSGYIFPLAFNTGKELVTVNNRDEAARLFMTLDVQTIRNVLNYYEGLDKNIQRTRIRERLEIIIDIKERHNVSQELQPESSS